MSRWRSTKASYRSGTDEDTTPVMANASTPTRRQARTRGRGRAGQSRSTTMRVTKSTGMTTGARFSICMSGLLSGADHPFRSRERAREEAGCE